MRVAGVERQTAYSGQIRMVEQRPHQQLAQPLSLMRGQDEHIADMPDRNGIRDHARKTDLRAITGIQTETKRARDGALHLRARAASRPIRRADKRMNHVQIEPLGVIANRAVAVLPNKCHFNRLAAGSR